MSTDDRILSKVGRTQLENVLARPTIPALLASRLPAEWTEAAIPPEPPPGAYIINGHLVARAAWDDLDDRWRYLGKLENMTGDLTWNEIWRKIGTAGAKIQKLVGVDGDVVLPCHTFSVFDSRITVSTPGEHATAAALLRIDNRGSASLDPDAAIKVASALVQAVHEYRNR